MTARDLLADLRRQGFNLTSLPGDKLEVRPFSKLPEDLREALRQCKAEVLALLTKPYVNDRGELIIPFDCDPRYHWWKPGGQNIAQILAELNAPPAMWRRYVAGYTETVQ